MSLRTRLILTHSLVILLTLAILAVSLVFILRDYQRQAQLAQLGDAVVPLAFQARTLLANRVAPREIVTRLEAQAEGVGRLMIINAQGLVLADAANGLTNRTVPLQPLRRATRHGFLWGTYPLKSGRPLLFVAVTVGQVGDQEIYIALTNPEQPFFDVLDEIGASILIAGGVTLVVSLLVALLLARSLARPIRQLTQATQAIAHGQYEQRVPVTGRDEIGRLAQSFNAMADQVQRARQRERELVANVSHELKTPITSIQGFAQAILDGTVQGEQGLRRAVQTIFDETARMARLIGNLLTLARLDAGQSPPAHESLDLTEWLPRWLERFRSRATAQNETLVAAMEPLPTITGDAGQLEQVLANLLDNALKYNRPGGTVTVTAKKLARTPQSPAAWITIAVSDEGPGIPKEELPHLFERFYRGDQARAAPGSGLGLAIAHEIVRAHGGRIEVDSTVGRGSTFTIYLPVP